MLTKFFAISILMAVVRKGEAFPDGAPTSTCYTMYPVHSGADRQMGPMPFNVTFTPTDFDPKDTIDIRIYSPTGKRIKGIQMAARRKEGNPEEFVGQFVQFPANTIKAFSCFEGFHNMITHSRTNHVTSIDLQWKAPDDFVGSVVFRTTILEDYDTFWVAEEEVLKAKGTGVAVPAQYPKITTGSLVSDIDFDSCGVNSTCFLYPRICDGTDCVAAAKFEHKPTGGYKVELFTKEGPDYIAIGFSHDTRMGKDSTVVCVSNPDNMMSVQLGWNPEYYNERQLTRDLMNPKVKMENGKVQCSFEIPEMLPYVVIDQTALSYQAEDMEFQLNGTSYLMLAWGKTLAGSDVIAEHQQMPAVTYSRVNLQDNNIHYGSAFHILIQSHGCIMIVSWVLLTGLVTVIARHYRDWFPQRRLFGTKIWFQIHRALAVLVAILTFVSLILVFDRQGIVIKEKAKKHAGVGLTVTACLCLQIIFGFTRPGPDHKYRYVFNLGHKLLGNVAHLLAAVTVFLAFDMVTITPDLRRLGFITSGVWVGGQVVWLIIFEIYSYCQLKYPVHSFSSGAPSGTCFTMYPHHSGYPQQESLVMPYTVDFSQETFPDGGLIYITLRTTDSNRLLRGFMLVASRATGNTEEFVGQFSEFDESKVKTINCFGGFQNLITHVNNAPIPSIRVAWRAPTEHVGNVIFRATLLENYSTFWVARNFTLPTSSPNLPIVASTYPSIPTSSLVTETDFSSCGNSKGCILYPAHCDGHNCIAAVSYQYRTATQDYLFEMFTKQGPNYLSLGFSSDRTMGDDFTVSCVANSGILSVQQGRNPEYHNEFQFTRTITEREIIQKDGDIQCRFSLQPQALAYLINQTAPSYHVTDEVFNLNDPWYLFLAWGHSGAGSYVMEYHEEMPAISLSKINLKDTSQAYASAFHIMVRVHASLMIIAWVLFTGLVTVIARHYRDWFPKKRLFGTKVWFQVHRELAILIVILTVIGIILVFAHYGSTLREPAGNHAKVGLAVLACVCVQLIAGFLRPGPDNSLRPFFNWGHRFLGHATHILSAATMFLAYDIEYITPDLREVGFITLGVWVGGQVLWHIIFEVYSCYHLRSDSGRSIDYDMDTRTATEHKEKKRNAIIDNVLITLYMLCLLAFTISIMVLFLFY